MASPIDLQVDINEIEEILRKAFEELERGNAEGAIELFNKVLKVLPRDPDATMGKAKSLFALGRVETAKLYFDKVSILEPKYNTEINDILSGRTSVHKLPKLSAAVGFRERWTKIDKKPTITQTPGYIIEPQQKNYSFGEMYSGLPQGIILELGGLDSILKDNPTNSKLWYQRGMIFFNIKRYEEALRSFDNALQYDTKFDLALNAKAETLDSLGRHSEAATVYQQVLGILKENKFGKKVERREKATVNYFLPGEVQKAIEKRLLEPEMQDVDKWLKARETGELAEKPSQPQIPQEIAHPETEPQKTEMELSAKELLEGVQPARKPIPRVTGVRPTEPPSIAETVSVPPEPVKEIDLLTKELLEGTQPVRPLSEPPKTPYRIPTSTPVSAPKEVDSLTRELIEGTTQLKTPLEPKPEYVPSTPRPSEPPRSPYRVPAPAPIPGSSGVDRLSRELLRGSRPFSRPAEEVPTLRESREPKEFYRPTQPKIELTDIAKDFVKKDQVSEVMSDLVKELSGDAKPAISVADEFEQVPAFEKEPEFVPAHLQRTDKTKTAWRGMEKPPILETYSKRHKISGEINGLGKVNGMINGSGRIEGVINGKKKFAGYINGRGRMDGLVNGRKVVSGLVNGMGRVNGMVNGQRVQGTLSGINRGSYLKEIKGIVNGRGHVNGMINGRRFKGRLDHINGLVNGAGSLNGMINGIGHINGTINGRKKVSGSIDSYGKISGWVNGNKIFGKVNGLAIPLGKVNGRGDADGRVNGLVNGRGQVNGLVNGMGYSGEPRRISNRRIMTRDFIITFSIVAILGFGAVLLYIPHEGVSGISVDGNFNDWAHIPMYSKNAVLTDPNIDINNYTVNFDNNKISFYLDVKGMILAGEPGKQSQSRDSVDIFIDSDMNPSTGYMINGIGADYMISIYGKAGVVEHSVLEYYPDSYGLDWSKWTSARDVKTAVSGHELETQVNSYDIGVAKNSKSVNVLFHTMDWKGNEDFSDAIINPSQPSLYVYQQSYSTTDTILRPSSNTEILDLTLKTYTAKVTVDKLIFNLDTNVAKDRLSDFTAVSNNGKKFAGNLSGNRIELDGALILNKNETRTIKVYTNFQYLTDQDRSEIFGIRLKSIDTLEQAVVTIKGDYTNINKYISIAPNQIIIDGAFGDWKGTKTGLISNVNDSNIYITNYDTKVQGSDVMFYLRVDGTMMGGKAVTTNVVSIPYQPPSKPPVPDSDRDTMNDSVDPFPHDFNNDGINDSATWGIHNGIYGPDVDGDGITDYPQGPDMWLNTTIPNNPDFPAAYRNQTVSVYIGPVTSTPTPLPVVTGEDNAYAFINSDDNNSTGCVNSQEGTNVFVDSIGHESGSWSSTNNIQSQSEQNQPQFTAPDGTDFLIHISGKENNLYSSKLYQWDNGNWSFIENISAAIDGEQIEFGTITSDLNIIGNFSVSYETEDWNKINDDTDNIVLPYDHTGPVIDTINNNIKQNEIIPDSNTNNAPKNSLQIDNTPVISKAERGSTISLNQKTGSNQDNNFYVYVHTTTSSIKKNTNKINEYSPDSRIFSGIPADFFTKIKNPRSTGPTADYIYIIQDLWWINVKDNAMDSIGITKDLVKINNQIPLGQNQVVNSTKSTSSDSANNNTISSNVNYKDNENINNKSQNMQNHINKIKSNDSSCPPSPFSNLPPNLLSLENYYAENTGPNSTTSTTPTVDTTLTATFVAGNYLVLASAFLKNSSTTHVTFFDIYDATSSTELALNTFCPNSNTDYYSTCAAKVVTGISAGSHTFETRFYVDNASYTASIKWTRIWAIHIPATYQYATTAGPHYTSSQSYQTETTLIFTPAKTQDYLVIAYAELYSFLNGTYQDFVNAKLVLGTSSQGDATLFTGGNNQAAGGGWFAFGMMRKINLAASSQTFTIQYESVNGYSPNGAGIRNATIFAVPVGDFGTDSSYQESEAESTNSSSTYSTKVTLTITPGYTANYYIAASALVNETSGSYAVYAQLYDNTTSTSLGEMRFLPYASYTNYEPFFEVKQVSLSSGSAHTFYLQYKSSSNSGTSHIKNARMFIIDPVAASVPPNAPVFYNTGSGSQICFNNAQISTSSPLFRVSATYTSTFTDFYIEINTASDFSGTDYHEDFPSTYSSGTQYDVTCSSMSPSFSPTNGTTYYVQAKASADSGSTWSSFSSGTYSFTYESSGNTNWFQTTKPQFDSDTQDTNINTTTTGGGDVEISGALSYSEPFTNSLDTWTASDSRWTAQNSNLAGGTAYEARFYYNGTGNGTYYLTSANIDTSGTSSATLSWANYVHDYMGYTYSYTVYAQTRHASGTWTTVWSWSPPSDGTNLGPGTQTVSGISGDIGYTDTQIRYYFTGSNLGIYGWYIDNISLTGGGSSTGAITSTSCAYASFKSPAPSSWNQVLWTADTSHGTLKVQVYYDVAGTPTIVPDSALTGNSAGFTSGSVSISGLATGTYTILYLKATLTYSGGSPALDDWTITCSFTGTIGHWLGFTDTHWNTTTNWSGSTVPTSSIDVVIDPSYLTGAKAWPTAGDTAIASAKTITVDSSATLILSDNASYELKVYGNIVNNGTIYADGYAHHQLYMEASGTISGTGVWGTGGYGPAPHILVGTTTVSCDLIFSGIIIDSGATLSFSSSNNLTLTGNSGASPDWTNNGTFNANNSTVVFSPTTGTHTVGGSSASSFYNMTVSCTSGVNLVLGDSTTGSLTFTVSGTFSWTSGNLQIGNGTGPKTDILSLTNNTVTSSEITIPSGSTLTMITTSAINLAGNWANNGGTFTQASSTITLNGTSGEQVVGGSSGTTFYNLTLNNTGTGVQFGDTTNIGIAYTVSNSFTWTVGPIQVGGDTTHTGFFAINYTISLTMTDDLTVLPGSRFWLGTGSPSGTGIIINTGNTLTAGSNTITDGDNWTTNGTFTGTSSGQSTLSTQGFNVSGTDTPPTGWAENKLSNGDGSAYLYFEASSSHPTISTPQEGSDYVDFNSYTCQSGDEIRLYQSSSFSTVGYTSIQVNFYWHTQSDYNYATEGLYLEYSTNGSTWTDSGHGIYASYNASPSWVSETYTLPSGAEGQSTLYLGFRFHSAYGDNCNLDIMTVKGTSASAGAPVILNGTGTQIIGGTSNYAFYSLTVNNSSTGVQFGDTTNTGKTFTVSSSFTWNDGAIQAGGDTSHTGLVAINYNITLTMPDNLTVLAGSRFWLGTGSPTGTGVIINASNTLSASTFTITNGDNWNNGGTFTCGTSTVTFTSTATGRTIAGSMTGSNEFNNITFNGSSGAWTFSANADVASDFTITAGTVNAPTTLNIGSDWSNSDTFNAGTGSVTFTGAVIHQVLGTTSFYKFIDTVGNSTLTFQATYTTAVLANGTFNVAGTAGNYITVDSTLGGSQAKLSVNNTGTTITVDYVNASDNDASGGKTINIATNGTIYNTINWNCPINVDKYWAGNWHYWLPIGSDLTANATSGKEICVQIDPNSSITAAHICSLVTSNSLNDFHVVYYDASVAVGSQYSEVSRQIVVDNSTVTSGKMIQVYFNMPVSWASGDQVYLYYGNPSPPSTTQASLRTNTFSDNFESGGLSNWSSSRSATVNGSAAWQQSDGVQVNGTNDYGYVHKDVTFPTTGSLEVWANTTGVASGSYQVMMIGGNSGYSECHVGFYGNGDIIYGASGNDFHEFSPVVTWTAGTWYYFRIDFNSSNHTYSIYINHTLEVSGVGYAYTNESLNWIELQDYGTPTDNGCYFDNFYLYTTTPAYTLWTLGSELDMHGAWSNPYNWSPINIPLSTQKVGIDYSHLNFNYTCNVDSDPSVAAGVYVVSEGSNSGVNDNFTNGGHTLTIGSTGLNISGGKMTLDGVSDIVDINGGGTTLSGGTLVMSNGEIDLTGNWNNTNTTFQATGGLVLLNGSAAQTVTEKSSNYFYNLIITNTGSAGTQVTTTSSFGIKGNYSNTSTNTTFVASTPSTITFNGSSSQTITTKTGDTFFNLSITNNTGVSLTSGLTITVAGTTSSAFSIGTASATSGTFTLNSGTILRMTGSSGGITVNSGGTFSMNGTYSSHVTINGGTSNNIYSFTLNGTINALYLDIKYSSGLTIASSAIITMMNDVAFTNTSAVSHITNSLPNAELINCSFDNSATTNDISTSCNINLYNCTSGRTHDSVSGGYCTWINIVISDVDYNKCYNANGGFIVCNNDSRQNNANYNVDLNGWLMKDIGGSTVYPWSSSTIVNYGAYWPGSSSWQASQTALVTAGDALALYNADSTKKMVDFVSWGNGSAPSGTELTNAVNTGNWDSATDFVNTSGWSGIGDYLVRNTGSSLPLKDTNVSSDWGICPFFPTPVIPPILGFIVIIIISYLRKYKVQPKKKRHRERTKRHY